VSCHGRRDAWFCESLRLWWPPQPSKPTDCASGLGPGAPPQADSSDGDRLRLPALFRSRSPITNATRNLENHRPTNRAFNHVASKSDFESLSKCFRPRIPRRGVIKAHKPRNCAQINQIVESLRYSSLIEKINANEASPRRQQPRFPTYTRGHTPPLTSVSTLSLLYHSTTTRLPLHPSGAAAFGAARAVAKPTGAALRLLDIARKHPEVLVAG
jgi:hypothetical protein